MAEKELKLVVSADSSGAQNELDKAEKKTGLLSRAFNLLRIDAVNLAKVGFSALKGAFAGSIGAALEQEAALGKLSSALKKHGNFTDENFKSQVNWANAMSLNVLAQDDAIIGAQGMLAQYGLAGEELKKATMAALDLSAATGTDLKSATVLMAKASQGSTETLGRYGVILDDSVPKSQKFAAALSAIKDKFGGAAQAEAETFSGKLKNLKKGFGEIAEDIGTAFLPIISDLVPILSDVGAVIKNVFDSKFFKASITAIRVAIVPLVAAIKIIGLSFIAVQESISEVVINAKIKIEDLAFHMRMNALKMPNIFRNSSEEIKKLQDAHAIKEKELNDALLAHKGGTWEKIVKVGKESAKEIADILKSNNVEIKTDTEKTLISDPDSVANSSKKAMSAVANSAKETKTFLDGLADKTKGLFDAAIVFDKGKFDLNAAAFGNAIKKRLIDDLTAHAAAESAKALIANWWNLGALAVPQIGFNLAGLAAGIAAVNAVQFQSGGIVPGASTSGDQVPIRVNSGEMILNKSQQSSLFNMIQNGGGGGGMNININGGIFMSDRGQAKQLAKMIDEELVTLGRQRQRVS